MAYLDIIVQNVKRKEMESGITDSDILINTGFNVSLPNKTPLVLEENLKTLENYLDVSKDWLTTYHGLPLIFLTLTPEYMIKDYPEIKNTIFEEIESNLGITKYDYYLEYIYKDDIQKRPSVDSEYFYSSISDCVNQLSWLRDSDLRDHNKIYLVFMGKYSEYIYASNILNNYTNKTTTHFIPIWTKPIHYYLDKTVNISNTIKLECNKIKKVFEENDFKY